MRRLIPILILLLLFVFAIAFYFWYSKGENKDYLILYGNVDVRQVDLGFRVPGRVETMPFQEGDFLSAGTLMATIEKQPYYDKVLQAVAIVESAEISLANARKLLKRRQELVKDGSVSKEDLEDAETNKQVADATLKQAEASLGIASKNLRDMEVYAPANGFILTRIREPGTVVKEGDPVYTLSLSNPIWVRAFVTEPELGLVYPSMPAEVFTDSRKNYAYKGHIGFISPVAEFTPKTVETKALRTDLVYRLRVIVDNPDWGLKQGMPVTVRLPLKQEPQIQELKEKR